MVAERLRARSALVPRVALVDAPPLDSLASVLADDVAVDGPFRLGKLDGVPVAVVPPEPDGVRAARLLGAEILLLGLSARPLDAELGTGVGVVTDHIGLLVANPLIGPNSDDLGPRFPDMSEAYDPALRALARREAERMGLSLGEGVYAALPGPNLATPAEYRMLRRLGADWVGMGGVALVVVARHMGLRVLALVALGGFEDRLAALVRGVVAQV